MNSMDLHELISSLTNFVLDQCYKEAVSVLVSAIIACVFLAVMDEFWALLLCGVLLIVCGASLLLRKRDRAVGKRVEADCCVICLEIIRSEAQASCGHIYCCKSHLAECILGYWQQQFRPQQCLCPTCRRPIALMVGRFSPETNAEMQAGIDDYNVRFSDSVRSLWLKVTDVPFVVHRILQDLGGVQAGRVLILAVYLILMLFYLLLPFDLLPEATLGVVGLLDDVAMVVIVLTWVYIKYFELVRRESAARLAQQ